MKNFMNSLSSANSQQSSLAHPVNQLVFIDGNVPDYGHLTEKLPANTEVILLNTESDGIEAITQVLEQRDNVESVHLVSHGNAGTLYLGNTEVNDKNLKNYASRIKEWQKALADKADLILYGCQVAAGSIGEAFVKQLSELINVNIAASQTLTGNKDLGGNWNLEFTTGKITTDLLFNDNNCANYGHVLNNIIGNETNEILLGNTNSNNIQGMGGDDVLNGRNIDAATTDSGSSLEHDVLVGGDGADTFIIGENAVAYYAENGFLDAAKITDFSLAEGDKIQLAGELEFYTVDSLNGNTRIFYNNDLILQIDGVVFDQDDLTDTNIFCFDNDFAPVASILRSQTVEDDDNAATDDELIGSQNYAEGEGVMERDILIGGVGKQTFVLGGSDGGYYDQRGGLDSALIQNFTEGEDVIRLHGSHELYELEVENGSTRIFLQGDGVTTGDDFIAQIDGVVITDLMSSNFQYIQAV
jgi:hypothetical protein